MTMFGISVSIGLDVVNLRVGGVWSHRKDLLKEPLTAVVELKREGMIRHIGLSNVTPKQFARRSEND